MERLNLVNAKIEESELYILQGGEYVPANDVLKLVQGLGDSQGFALVGEALAVYFANTQGDTQTVITKLVEAIDQVIAIANTAVVKTPNTPAVPLSPEAAAELETIKAELQEVKLI